MINIFRSLVKKTYKLLSILKIGLAVCQLFVELQSQTKIRCLSKAMTQNSSDNVSKMAIRERIYDGLTSIGVYTGDDGRFSPRPTTIKATPIVTMTTMKITERTEPDRVMPPSSLYGSALPVKRGECNNKLTMTSS